MALYKAWLSVCCPVHTGKIDTNVYKLCINRSQYQCLTQSCVLLKCFFNRTHCIVCSLRHAYGRLKLLGGSPHSHPFHSQNRTMDQSPLLNPFVNLFLLYFPSCSKAARSLACLLLPAWCVDSRLLKQEEMVTQQTRAELLGRVVCWGVGSRWRCSSPAVYLPAEMDSNALMFEVFMAVKGLPFSETAFSIQLSHVPQHWVRFCLFGWVCVCVLGRQCSFCCLIQWYNCAWKISFHLHF